MLAPRRGGARPAPDSFTLSSSPDAAPRTRRGRPKLTLAPVPTLPGELTEKQQAFIARRQPQTPCVIVDVDMVETAYRDLASALPSGRLFYAIKANPAAAILARLRDLGASFDVASPGEIQLCRTAGIPGDRISYGSTIKKERDIAYAFAQGVRLFAFDSIGELEKIARAAPGADVFCRLLWQCGGAEWPLSRKFGCSPRMAADLLLRARALGLNPRGLSFHVGSQQTDLTQYDAAIAQAAAIFAEVGAQGLPLDLVNVGGGFPSRYRSEVPPVAAYGAAIEAALDRHFPHQRPQLIAEPGRSIVGDAGVLMTEVVLVSTKDEDEDKRWVYLDVGKFSGLAETMDEAIKYRLRTPHDGGPTGPVILAGPTCDSADILYETFNYDLPTALKDGDKLLILSAGAYTTTYSAVGFNGFRPLKDYCI